MVAVPLIEWLCELPEPVEVIIVLLKQFGDWSEYATLPSLFLKPKAFVEPVQNVEFAFPPDRPAAE